MVSGSSTSDGAEGAEILIYPTAIGWESSDTDDEKARQLNAWIISQRGHAVANGLPVVSVNRVGHEPDPSMQTNGILFWEIVLWPDRKASSWPKQKRTAGKYRCRGGLGTLGKCTPLVAFPARPQN